MFTQSCSLSRLTKIYFIKANTEQSIQASYFDIAIDNGIVQAQDWHAGIHWLHSNQVLVHYHG